MTKRFRPFKDFPWVNILAPGGKPFKGQRIAGLCFHEDEEGYPDKAYLTMFNYREDDDLEHSARLVFWVPIHESDIPSAFLAETVRTLPKAYPGSGEDAPEIVRDHIFFGNRKKRYKTSIKLRDSAA